jgi:hypothetical protein
LSVRRALVSLSFRPLTRGRNKPRPEDEASAPGKGPFLKQEPMKWATDADELTPAEQILAAHCHGLAGKGHGLTPGALARG